jgi:hypothetical protein
MEASVRLLDGEGLDVTASSFFDYAEQPNEEIVQLNGRIATRVTTTGRGKRRLFADRL